MNHYNILTEPIIRYVGDSPKLGALPGVLSALMRDEVIAFPALRPHQRHPWHAFLVQLGALAIYNSGSSEIPREASDWLRLIRNLTPDFKNDEPWHLVIDDIAKPAFMQPPASSGERLSDYKSTVITPDQLDMLVTSKNHDLKSAVALSGGPDDWLFALISLQTQEGFSGAGNYGISRMNGGLGCRPAFSVTPSARPGGHVRRDVEALLERRERLLDDYPMHERGIQLLWLQSWDGAKVESLSLDDLDPFYIEVCRRIRLQSGHRNRIHARRATSKAPRVEARMMKGDTGDPWTPVDPKESKSLTLSSAGFNYRRTAEYLTDWRWSPLMELTRAERNSPQPMMLVARGMVRGQGKTEGYHERIVPFRERVMRAIGRPGGVEELGDLARDRIEEIRRVQRILRHAVSVFASGGKTDGVGEEYRDRANPWANRLDEIVDFAFFDELQEEYEAGVDDRRRIRHEWQDGVIKSARGLLRQAQDTLPCPAIQRYRAQVRSDSVFEGRMRSNNGFPHLFDHVDTEVHNDQ